MLVSSFLISLSLTLTLFKKGQSICQYSGNTFQSINCENFISKNGKLKLTGLQLTNQYGDPIQLRGISSHGLQWFPNCITQESITYMVNNMGINVFRIVVYISSNDNGYQSNPNFFDNYINNIISWCELLGIYVIIDWHVLTPGDPNAWLDYPGANTGLAIDFWKKMATLYGSKSFVLYEISNEPNGVDWQRVLLYHNSVISTIRSIDPETIIFAGTTTYSQDIDLPYTYPVQQPYNVMYSFHFYAATHFYLYSRFVQYSQLIPIFVTEWGYSEASGDGNIDPNTAQQYLDYMAGINSPSTSSPILSWVSWSYCDKSESSALLNPNTCHNKLWSQLSCGGSYLQSYLLKEGYGQNCNNIWMNNINNTSTLTPTNLPTYKPSNKPTYIPTTSPSTIPTILPSSISPTSEPSFLPSFIPTIIPTTSIPTFIPTFIPSILPTFIPTSFPSNFPSTIPSILPTIFPTSFPTILPSFIPTFTPSISTSPTSLPSSNPTSNPSLTPSFISHFPTISPTHSPTNFPTSLPSSEPTSNPTSEPSSLPTSLPSSLPTSLPSSLPTSLPTSLPSSDPSSLPSSLPTSLPSSNPTSLPSSEPSSSPTSNPSSEPSSLPTSNPSSLPTSLPSLQNNLRSTSNDNQNLTIMVLIGPYGIYLISTITIIVLCIYCGYQSYHYDKKKSIFFNLRNSFDKKNNSYWHNDDIIVTETVAYNSNNKNDHSKNPINGKKDHINSSIATRRNYDVVPLSINPMLIRDSPQPSPTHKSTTDETPTSVTEFFLNIFSSKNQPSPTGSKQFNLIINDQDNIDSTNISDQQLDLQIHEFTL